MRHNLAKILAALPLAWTGFQASAPAEDAAPIAVTSVDLSPAYPWDPGKDFDKAFAPEIDAEAAQVKWKKEVELSEEGVVNLNERFGDPVNVVVYARVFLESDAAVKARITMGSDDGLTLIVNGKKVFAKNAMRGMKPNEDAVDADLVQGRNVLLFRVTQGTGGFALQLSIRALGKAFIAQVHEELPSKARIAFTLDAEALTSAGIFDAQGKLVRTLWRMRRFPAGRQERPWDGLDEFDKPKPEEIRWFKKPGEKEAQYAVFGMDVDPQGSIWFGEHHSKAIWTIPVKEFNAAGNPVYDWADAKAFAPRDESPLKFEPNMAQHADDGSVYAFGWSAAWPSPKNNPFWMGGTTLVKFNAKGERQWAVKLPAVCVGLDVIPGGGGCMAGSGAAAALFHFNADGLHIGTLKPGEAMGKESGWMDNHASVAVSRDPRDGLLDVFAEDDYVLRVGWYRVNDRDIRTIEGGIRLP